MNKYKTQLIKYTKIDSIENVLKHILKEISRFPTLEFANSSMIEEITLFVYVCMYVCMYACMHVHMYVYISSNYC